MTDQGCLFRSFMDTLSITYASAQYFIWNLAHPTVPPLHLPESNRDRMCWSLMRIVWAVYHRLVSGSAGIVATSVPGKGGVHPVCLQVPLLEPFRQHRFTSCTPLIAHAPFISDIKQSSIDPQLLWEHLSCREGELMAQRCIRCHHSSIEGLVF